MYDYAAIRRERKTARNIPADDARYLCDLDFHEDVSGNDAGYTVNAHTSGKFTFHLPGKFLLIYVFACQVTGLDL